jgi:hypothetical protein
MTATLQEYSLHTAVNALLAARKEVVVYWDVTDVQSVRPDLTEEQAWSVLQDAVRHHDAGIGINWHVLEFHAAERYGEEPETPEPDLPTPFDSYEIEPCIRMEEPDRPGHFYFEPCSPSEAHVWTLYGHIPGQGVEAIGDFPTREAAAEVFARITGRQFDTLSNHTNSGDNA